MRRRHPHAARFLYFKSYGKSYAGPLFGHFLFEVCPGPFLKTGLFIFGRPPEAASGPAVFEPRFPGAGPLQVLGLVRARIPSPVNEKTFCGPGRWARGARKIGSFCETLPPLNPLLPANFKPSSPRNAGPSGPFCGGSAPAWPDVIKSPQKNS